MGVKDLWTILTPHAERKPISELRGKTVAIDLAGWVCESLNVVDYFVHPRHHLKNLFFRTCYLIWEEVTPVFVLEGAAPKLKSQTIAKRNEIQFRGVKPKEQNVEMDTQKSPESKAKEKNVDKGRTRFNHVLKQCETLLIAMGLQCVQGPGEAEAYCAYLNKIGLVDGVISQDSDCFAYGAIRVYRNFSVSSQGAQAAQGGAIDIYDMSEITTKMDFGQNKVIVMALLCGCDYCPDGIGGVGRDSVVKLFQKYSNADILERLRNWRREDAKYTALEMRVDDKTICTNCGHLGRTQSHTKSGCGVCRTNRGCDESLWKEERLSIKAELQLRKKALADASFPSEDIIEEFLNESNNRLPNMNLNWRQPNIVKFIKQIGHLLQWPELYCFQKFFPILTRWQVRHSSTITANNGALAYVQPKEIIKKRTVKGVLSLEILWEDEKGFFNGLIPDEQIENYIKENVRGLQELWSTIEPLNMLETAYPDMVHSYMNSKCNKKNTKTKANTKKNKPGSFENLDDLVKATNDISKSLKQKPIKNHMPRQKRNGLQMIDKFFKQNVEKALEAHGKANTKQQCSTPITKCLPSDYESDCDDNEFNLSAIIDGIVNKPALNCELKNHVGRKLYYEPITHNLSMLLEKQNLDDMDVLAEKRKYKIIVDDNVQNAHKRFSFDDSFDALVNKKNHELKHLHTQYERHFPPSPLALKQTDKEQISVLSNSMELHDNKETNVSYFYDMNNLAAANENCEDVFEQLMEINLSKKIIESDDCVLLSD